MLINNNYNVWQPPIAKHYPITSLPPTITIPPNCYRRHCCPPCDCPHGPSEGRAHHTSVMPDNSHHVTASTCPLTTSATSPLAHTCNHRQQQPPATTSLPITSVHATSHPLIAPTHLLTTPDNLYTLPWTTTRHHITGDDSQMVASPLFEGCRCRN